MSNFKLGDLVKVIAEPPAVNKVFGWLPAPRDVEAVLFEKPELYGLYIRISPCYNGQGWHEILTESNIYTFYYKQITFVQ